MCQNRNFEDIFALIGEAQQSHGKFITVHIPSILQLQFSACANHSHSNVLEGVEEQHLSSAPFPLKAGSHYICRTALLRNILDLPRAWWKVLRLVGPFTFALSIRQTERRRHKDPQQRERASLASDWQWLCLMYYPRIDRNKSAEVAGGGLHTTARSRKRDRRIFSSNTNLSTVKK